MSSAFPLISVVIPIYNGASFLRRSIGSVLAQSFRDYEIIVVDDGSTDDTASIIRIEYPTVRYFYQENRGLSAARNLGMREARGLWIAYLDVDDHWQTEKLNKQTKLFDGDSLVGVVYCGETVVDERNGTLLKRMPVPMSEPARELLFENRVTGGGSAAVIRKEALEYIGGYDENLSACEDWDIWLRIAVTGNYKFDFVAEPLLNYTLHSGNMHHNLARMLRNHELVLDKFFSQKELSSEIQSLRTSAFGHWYYRFAPELYWQRDLQGFRDAWAKLLQYKPLYAFQPRYVGMLLKSLLGTKVLDFWKRVANIKGF